jgi:exosortase
MLHVATPRTASGVAAVPVEKPTSRWSRLLAILALAELAILYAPTVAWLFDRWTMSVWQHMHGLLIPPVVAYFVYQELRPLSGLPRSSSPWGFALLAPALAITALDAGMHTELLSAAALVLAIPGLSFLFLGAERTRRILLPLGFLAFALPIPLALTEQITWQLRLIVTAATEWTVRLMGIPLYVEGTTLQFARETIEIADACSGFSTLYAAMSVACLIAYGAKSAWRRGLVILAAAPIAIASNILRVVILVLLTLWQGEQILDTFIHPLSGMLTFALSLPIIFWLGGDVGRRTQP